MLATRILSTRTAQGGTNRFLFIWQTPCPLQGRGSRPGRCVHHPRAAFVGRATRHADRPASQSLHPSESNFADTLNRSREVAEQDTKPPAVTRSSPPSARAGGTRPPCS